MNDELIELQTQMSFQEDTIAQLNDVVTRQQKDINELKRALESLAKQVRALVDDKQEQEDNAPPHY